jgi:hypothetical protein
MFDAPSGVAIMPRPGRLVKPQWHYNSGERVQNGGTVAPGHGSADHAPTPGWPDNLGGW